MKYINTRNSKVMEIVKQDTQKGTMIIRFEDGSTSAITTGTFKRWYKEWQVPETVEVEDYASESTLTEDEMLEQAVVDPDEAYVREVMEQKKELGIECPKIKSIELVDEDTCADGRTYAEIGKEIAEQAKQRCEQARAAKKTSQTKPSKEMQQWVKDAMDDIFGMVTGAGDEVFVPNGVPMRTFKVGGHMYAKFNYSKSSITLAVKSSSISEFILSIRKPDRTLNHMFDAVYTFKQELTVSDQEFITGLLAGARAQRLAKNEGKQSK